MNNPWKGKHGPLMIAEIGGNHMGDFEYAKRLTELAIDADVDYVKYQLYSEIHWFPDESPDRNAH
jgi:N-acetylneuraminate synthase/N,N'-diacetyllegionaminate synthase